MDSLCISRRTAIAAAVSALAVSACGFRPRGAFELPFKTIYLQISEKSTLRYEIQRHLEAETLVKVITDPEEAKEAEATLRLLGQRRSRVALTYNDRGNAREYRIGNDMTFSIVSPDGFEFLAPVTLSARRDLPYTERNYLSRDVEEATLHRDIEKDIAIQLMRRIKSSNARKQ